MILKGDFETYDSTSWYAMNNVWNRGSLTNGVDYQEFIWIDEQSFPDNLLVTWDWPDSGQDGYTVRAYPEIVAGLKPWDGRAASTVAELPVQIAAIGDIDLTLSTAWGSNDSDEFNIAVSLWLNNDPVAGAAGITTEIMIWTKSGAFNPSGDEILTSRDGLGDFSLYRREGHGNPGDEMTWDYFALKYDAAVEHGVVKIDDLLQYLVAEGLISATDYLMSVEVGAEVTGGQGWFQVNKASLAFSDKALPSTVSLDDIYAFYDAGAGLDVVTVKQASAAAIVTVDDSVKLAVGAMAHELVGVERIVFSDATLVFDAQGTAAGQVYRLYQAALDRAPDTAGLSYWTHALEAGVALADIAQAFVSTIDILHPNLSNRGFVDLLYDNVKGAPGEGFLVDYWEWMQNTHSRASVLLSFSEGAENLAGTSPALAEGIWLI